MNTMPQNTAPAGKLIIRDKDNNSYTLLGPPEGSGEKIEYRFTDSDSPCPADVGRTFQVTEFPSATRIFMCDRDHYYDGEDQNFYMEFITTRKRTSVSIVELEIIASYLPREIVEPGVQVLRVFRKSNAYIRDSLAFVSITAATAAPAPVRG